MGAAIKVTKMFDFVFIGTGAPCLLEAAFWSLKGKSVLMIDQENEIGGAWKSLNIFGYTNVENAVHYFLDNTLGIKFLQNKLNVPIEISSNKYRVFQFPLSVSIKLPFDNKFGKVISCFIGNFPQKINYIIKSIISNYIFIILFNNIIWIITKTIICCSSFLWNNIRGTTSYKIFTS